MNAYRSIRGRWRSMVVLIAVAAMLAVCIAPALASALTCPCGDICVNTSGWWKGGGAFNSSSTQIQEAVDNASSGETICVEDGTYNENVNVNVAHLTIRSENGSANCIVNALDSNDHVFNVAADYVNISGFTVTNATASDKAGIYLSGREHCNISDNNVTNNCHGIFLHGKAQHIAYTFLSAH